MTAPPELISDMRNLGPVSERQLREIGINTPEELKEICAVESWLRLKFVFGRHVNRNFLFAIEGHCGIATADTFHLK